MYIGYAMLISLSLFVTSKRGCQHIQCEHFDLFYDSPLSQFTWLVCGYVCVCMYVCVLTPCVCVLMIVAVRSIAKDIRFEYSIVTLC